MSDAPKALPPSEKTELEKHMEMISKPSIQYSLVGDKLRGPADKIIASIEADERIPDEDKVFLISKIKKSGFEGVAVHAHDHFCAGHTICGSYAISKIY
jgi:hypothetical protein